MDFTALTDDELATHLNTVLAEQERRQALATIPDQIVELKEKFLAGGGKPQTSWSHTNPRGRP